MADLEIEELEGARRQFSFSDTYLPEQGVAAGASLRAVVTEYPGNSQKSVQILGVTEDDIEIRGQFNSVLGRTQGGSAVLTNAVKGLLVGQALCELRWGGTLVVRGYVKSFEPVWRLETLAEYRLVFLVVQADRAELLRQPEATPATPRKVVRALDTLSAGIEELEDQVARLNAIRGIA